MNRFLLDKGNYGRYWLILLLLPFLTQCKDTDQFGLSLAVNTDTIRLDTAAGKTHIMVYSTGSWSVAFKMDTNWISLNKTRGHGNSDVTFSYGKNYGPSRSATLILTKGSTQKRIFIIQEGVAVKMRFSQNRFTLPKQGLKTILPVVGNIKGYYKSVRVEYLYDDETMEKWVTKDTLTKDGFVFESLDNNSGRKRSVRIYLTIIDASDEEHVAYVDIDQTLDAAFLLQKYGNESRLTKDAKVDTVVLEGNVGAQFPVIESTVSYGNGSGWIEDVSLSDDSLLLIAVRENNSGASRRADIHLGLTVKGQKLIDLTHHVYQSNSGFEEISFQELRGLIPAASGTATIDAPLQALEGIVISDRGNPNMETNPHNGFKTIDLDETYRTAYVQSLDGQYGFRIKFATQGENTLERYDQIKISVDGLMLQKQANPARYTLLGVKAADIVNSKSGTENDLTEKLRFIGELTDADLYTYVTLKGVSISVPYGSYMNVNRGYALKTDWNRLGTTLPYVDAIPTNVFDRQGDNLNLLVNASAPWAVRDLPRGSGTISGIVTHSQLLRYGAGEGEIGRYQLRPVNAGDIKLDATAIATTLVEWNWLPNGTGTCASGTVKKDANGKVLPFVGNGLLSCTVAGATASPGWNPVCHSNPDSKTVYNNGCQFTGVKWWNAADGEGEGYVLQFSTAGVSAQQLLLNFSINGGSGSDATNHVPVFWQVEYSLDGVNFSAIPNGDFVVRPLVQWNKDRPFQTPGLRPYSFKLPETLLGKSAVYVKLKAVSDICAAGSPTGGEAGRITADMPGTTVRVGNISVKYIQ